MNLDPKLQKQQIKYGFGGLLEYKNSELIESTSHAILGNAAPVSFGRGN
jgi:hypothetical protein